MLANPRYARWARDRYWYRRRLAALTLLFFALLLFLPAFAGEWLDALSPDGMTVYTLFVFGGILALLGMLHEFGRRARRVSDRRLKEIIREAIDAQR
ncbi:MAG: DUF485 domain-containing protein [Zoogloeaceae bacterium]|nr:DUF485 domain-containing protein [Zoogloeaceae bacterium]